MIYDSIKLGIMSNEKLEIKVFGDKAKQISEGQNFIATVGSVEGRTVVTLTPTPGAEN